MKTIDKRRKPKSGRLSESVIHLEVRCHQAKTTLKAVCDELGIPFRYTYQAFWRGSVKGKAGRYRRMVLDHLKKKILQEVKLYDVDEAMQPEEEANS